MEKIKRTIDDIFNMSDSRYSLVNAISRKAREIADEAENNHDVLYRKPVNMVIDRLLDGRATIEHIEDPNADDLFAEDSHTVPSVSEATVPVYAELAAAEYDGEDGEDREDDEDGDNEDEGEDEDKDFDSNDDDTYER